MAEQDTARSNDNEYRFVCRDEGWDQALECYKRGKLTWVFKPRPGSQSDRCFIKEFHINRASKSVRVSLNSFSLAEQLVDPGNGDTFFDEELDLDSGTRRSQSGPGEAYYRFDIERYKVGLIEIAADSYGWLLEDTDRLFSLEPETFEKLVADRLSAMGLDVRLVGRTNRKDGGIDIVAWPAHGNGFPFLIAAQVKHHRVPKKSGVGEVRDFYGTLTSKQSPFHLGVMVTNTSFTADAGWFANQNSHLVRLRDLRDLCRWMRNDFDNTSDWREIPRSIRLAPGIEIEISKAIWTPDGCL